MRTAERGARAKWCASSAEAMMKARNLLVGALLGVWAFPAAAQEYMGYPSYAAWKAATYNVTIDPHPHPAPPPVMEERGGGTGTCDCWHEPDGSYTTINNGSGWDASGWSSSDDGSYGPINLPFQFYLYGQYWNSAYININGNVSFGQYFGTFSSTGFPVADFTMVAPFWADVDLGGVCAGCNQVSFKVTPTALFVNWKNVGYYPSQTNLLNTFQLIITDGTDPVIPDGANVSFCYQDMQWTTGGASQGVGGFGGIPASVGANHGNGVDYMQFGRFDHAGTDYDGPLGANDGVSFLDNQYFRFSTDVTQANVPPVITGQSACDTITLCVNETTTLEVSFLSPEPDQITVPAVSAPTFTGPVTVVSSTNGLNAQITVEVTPEMADVGYQVITFTGTDNGVPVGTSILNVVIEVISAASMEPGSASVCSDGTPVDMYALINGIPVPGGDWTDPQGNAHTGQFLPGEDPDGVYLYAVDQGGNCPNSTTVTMTSGLPVNAGNDVADLAYCEDHAAVDLFDLLGNGAQAGGTWKYPDGSIFTGTLQPATDQDGTYSYLVYGTDPCPNDTAFVDVSIEQLVNAGENASMTLCADAAPLTLLNALGGDPDTGGTWAAPGNQSSNGTFDPGTGPAGTYTYTVNAVQPCPSQSSTVTIALDPLPQAGTSGTIAVCEGGAAQDLFQLLGGGPDGGGNWSGPDGAPHPAVFDPSVEGTGTYTYMVIGPGTCQHLSDTATVAITVNPLPVISFTVEPDSGCVPLMVTFTNTTDPVYLGGNCAWDFGDESGLSDCGEVTHDYTVPGWYNVRLEVTTPQGCTDRFTLQGAVLADPAPTAEFSWSPGVGTPDNSTLLFTAQDPHASVFDWRFHDGDSSSTRQTARTYPAFLSGEYEVCLSVADRYGCADSLCRTIEIQVPLVYTPNAFSPDGNGVNEVFLPVVSGMVAEEHELMIFDRWGQRIFKSTDPLEGWNGSKDNGGEVLPNGVYNWRLVERPIGSADKKDWFGTVTLLR